MLPSVSINPGIQTGFSALRVYALSQGRRAIAILICALGLTPVASNLVSNERLPSITLFMLVVFTADSIKITSWDQSRLRGLARALVDSGKVRRHF